MAFSIRIGLMAALGVLSAGFGFAARTIAEPEPDKPHPAAAVDEVRRAREGGPVNRSTVTREADRPARPARGTIPAGAEAVVSMTDAMSFDPGRITIPVGGTVVWRNASGLNHTVTAAPDLAGTPINVRLPDGAEPFNSGPVQPGEIYARTFTVPGLYRYFCIPHEAAGMTGEIVVE